MLRHIALGIGIALAAALAVSGTAGAQDVEINVPIDVRNLPREVLSVIVGCSICDDTVSTCDELQRIAGTAYGMSPDAERKVVLTGVDSYPPQRYAFSDTSRDETLRPRFGRSVSEATWYRCQMTWQLETATGRAYVVPGPTAEGPARTLPGTPLVTEVMGRIPR